ncbi:pilus assembly protein TadE [Massilia violaceinigra]|uniref:Pilus assembly protein TadE n=1 Tax=Massilia violaceinigra TaxID=2045208 RepID=A0A2D2DUS3_9BURK|nr:MULTISPECIES: TadE/TadG family type IV pilus assembly protein [Massilia]ATQ78722.1 pilus assembly protein TadE [Massilia violaceinigra]MDQ1814628.1 TadE/TadG family type IV pilus assembly protein [Massilia sp. CCM 9210]
MKKRQQGVALVEFAFVLPLLLILSLVCAELGRAVYRYNTTAKTVRNAVRYLSVQTPGTHVVEARNMILYGNVAGTGTLLDPALTAANVPAPTWQTAGSDPLMNTVTIRVSGYQFRPLMANMFGARFAVISFNDISATMRSPL